MQTEQVAVTGRGQPQSLTREMQALSQFYRVYVRAVGPNA